MSSVLRPLRQDSAISDPDLALGARLLSHAPQQPKSEARKRRVWNALSSGGGSRLGFKLSALHVAFASVLFAAASSAAVGGYYVQHRAAEAAAPVVAAAPAAPQRARPSNKRRATAPAPGAPAAEVEGPVAAIGELAALPRAPQARKAESAMRGRSAAPDADAELLVEAMRARSTGNAKRVSELTDQYRAKHPQGALQEEALILSIESAATRHAPNTAALGREYLARFPNGRFAAQARRALGDAAR